MIRKYIFLFIFNKLPVFGSGMADYLVPSWILLLMTVTGGAVFASSGKKGLAVGHHDFLCDDLKAFPGLNWW